MDILGGKGGSLPLIPPFAFKVGFCLPRYRRWDTRFRRLCMLCRWSLLYSFFLLASKMSISFIAQLNFYAVDVSMLLIGNLKHVEKLITCIDNLLVEKAAVRERLDT
jgi:hypothetical protein